MSEEVKKTIPEHSFRCRFEHKSIFVWKDITTDMMFKDKKIVMKDNVIHYNFKTKGNA